jgi:hypothetical protein
VSTDPTGQASTPGTGPRASAGQPSEEELRAAYEAELSRITSADMILQAAVSLLNIGGRRLGLAARAPADGPDAAAQDAAGGGEGERDLEQVRDAVDAVRALLEILERRLPTELGPLRDALSQLQLAYAREVKVGAAEPPTGASATEQGQATAAAEDPAGSKRPGPAETSGRLWVPGR